MKEKSISRLKDLWVNSNKIKSPVKAELYLNIIDQVANLFSAGSFYYFIMNFDPLMIEYVDSRVESVIGIKPEDYELDTILGLLHPDDLKKMHQKESKAGEFLFNHLKNSTDILRYKVAYLFRIKHTNGTYRTILHQSKALTLSEDGKIQQTLGIHTDVTYLNMPIDHKISFISDTLPSYYSVSTGDNLSLNESGLHNLFTPREKEILRLIAQGKAFSEIANFLNISPHTINTHKKNILKKTDCNNTTELIARCVREGVI